MPSSQEPTQTTSTPNSTQNIPALPPELNPALARNDGASGPSLEQIRALVNPVAEATRRAAMRDGGFQAPQVLPNPIPEAAPTPAAPTPESAPSVEPDPLSFVPDLDNEPDKKDEETAQPTEEPKETEDKAEDTEDAVTLDSKAENFKQLRTIVKETKTELQAAQAEAKKLKQELETYKTGEALPEVIKEKEARIAQLEPLEHLHSLRTSRQYHERYIEPLSGLQEKLHTLADEYEIPAELLDEASQVENQAELNRWLSEHFDPLGAQDARALIRDIKTLQASALAAEQEPKTALTKMIQEARSAEETQRKEQFTAVHQSSRKGWVSALAAHKERNLLPELILQDGDEEHNRTYVRPVLTKAGEEYGKIVKSLFNHGLKELPDELAFALANACQLAHATSVQATIRNAAQQHAEELAAAAMESRKYNRPAVGSTSGMSNGAAPSMPERLTPEQAAVRSREMAARAIKK